MKPICFTLSVAVLVLVASRTFTRFASGAVKASASRLVFRIFPVTKPATF